MGFFADLKMAFNPSTQTKDYAARTAKTIARQQGKKVSDSREAQFYMKKKGITLDDLGDTTLVSAKSSPSKKSTATDNIDKSLRPKVRPKQKPISFTEFGDPIFKDDIKSYTPFGDPIYRDIYSKPKPEKIITSKPVKQKRGNKKPNALGYGYYNRQNVWIPPDIDMQDGGGPGISGQVFGSRGGVEADKEFGNNDGYVTAGEAAAAAEAGKFKYGIGRLSNAVGATPFGSGEPPTGIAGVVASGGPLASLMGNEYKPRTKMFGPGLSMTQEQVDAYMKEVQERRDEAFMGPQYKSTNDGSTATATEVVKAPDDPCPEGYMMDPTTKQCVIDPFKTAFADPVTGGSMPVATGVVSPYTQVANMTLGQLNPTVVANMNPLAMQQANMPPQGGLGSLAPVLNRTS
tara:strand:+ start:3260 stop:4468 length:1209 start_codon:yes stop_codon:yes gene_type:complete